MSDASLSSLTGILMVSFSAARLVSDHGKPTGAGSAARMARQ
jgi:hypothetical protein